MYTYRTGAAGSSAAALAMALHLLEETLPRAQAALAAYYHQALAPPPPKPGSRSLAGATVAEPRRDVDPRLARLLGLDPDRSPTVREISHLLAGQRIDGAPIPGKQVQRASASLAELLGLDAARVPTKAQIKHIVAGRRADGSLLQEAVPGTARDRLLQQYGVPPGHAPLPQQVAHIQAGRRADGAKVSLGGLQRTLAASRTAIGYIDCCFSADKSVSIAWALAHTEAERAMIGQAHQDAVSAAMLHVEAEIGRARKGKGGRDGHDVGTIAWVRFGHATSRPTVTVVREDPETELAYTDEITVNIAGDPQLHTHVAVPNVVLTENGRVGGLDLGRLEGRVAEFGAYYQAQLATHLRRHGVEVALDPQTGAARITAIPEAVRTAFSKRTTDGTKAAQEQARRQGLDWDTLDAERRVTLLKQGVQGNPRQAKQDDLGDMAAWRDQAQALGWAPRSVLRPEQAGPPPDRAARREQAYQVARELLDVQFQRRSVLDEADARVAATRGLIAAGVEEAAEITEVVRELSARGVRHDGQDVTLVWGMTLDAQGEEVAKLTSSLHVEREQEAVALAREAAADRSVALSKVEIDAAVERSGKLFAEGHGAQQRAVMDRLGQGGRLAVAVGVAGSGKTTLLAPLVDAWSRQGRTVHGVAVAWRQADDLAGAGIAKERLAATAVFLSRAERGEVQLGADDVVVVDELGLLGTRQLLELLRLRKRHGFQLVMVGDPRQCQAIEAGPAITLLRRALGEAAIPELLSTVRQQTQAERDTSLLFRQGEAAEALARKRENGTAEIVLGGYAEAVQRVAALWRERREVNASDPAYTLTVSAPTNADAREVAAAIRHHRRALGELGRDEVSVKAQDQNGAEYDLLLAVGDRVRLFARTNASFVGGGNGVIGNNGSVLTVRAIGKAGLTLCTAGGREGLVRWETLRRPKGGRVKLGYGDVLSIDATQGVTSDEHIEAMPAGTRAVNAFKAYTSGSRHRRATFLVTSDGAERAEVRGRRPLGDPRALTEADVWLNMARNLSRTPEKASALAFLEKAWNVRQGAVRALQEGLQPGEQRMADGLAPSTVAETLERHQAAEAAVDVVAPMGTLVEAQGGMLARLLRVPAAVHGVLARALADVAPQLRQVAERIRQRARVKAEQLRREAAAAKELATLRAWLLERRMAEWRRTQEPTQRAGSTEAEVNVRIWAEVTTLSELQIRQVVARWNHIESETVRVRRASPGLARPRSAARQPRE